MGSFGLYTIQNAQEILHVMPDLVGDHIRPRKVTWGTKTVAEILKKAHIQVEIRIPRTIKRPYRSAG
jgi:hypothetical protein